MMIHRLPLGNGVHVDSVNSKNAAQVTNILMFTW